MSKTCRICAETKKLQDFPRHKGRKDGRDSRCRACRAFEDFLRRQRIRSEENGYDLARRRSVMDDFILFRGATRQEVLEETKFTYRLRDALNGKAGFIKYHVDHIQAIADGGSHRVWNLRVIPAGKNVSRWSDVVDECEGMTDEEIEAWEMAEVERLKAMYYDDE